MMLKNPTMTAITPANTTHPAQGLVVLPTRMSRLSSMALLLLSLLAWSRRPG